MAVTLSAALNALASTSAPDKVIVLEGSTAKQTDPANVGGAGYLKYVALLTQSGTSAPTATVLENTLGGTVVWSYLSVGQYVGTLTGAFVENKFFSITTTNPNGASIAIAVEWLDIDSFRIVSLDGGGSPIDGAIFYIEIRVYP